MPKESQLARSTREAGEHAAEKHLRADYDEIEAVVVCRLETAYAWALYQATIARSDTATDLWHRVSVFWREAHAEVVYSDPREWDDPENADANDPSEWLALVQAIAKEPGKNRPQKVIAGIVADWLAAGTQ